MSQRVAVVLPCYNVEQTIESVVQSIPEWVTEIIAVNDASRDGTQSVLDALSARRQNLTVLRHETNGGVGAAMRTGYRHALTLAADIVVKVDADGQMDLTRLASLLLPLLRGEADYAKGNRFRHPEGLRRMPWPRLLGNIVLTFMTKLATGYWHVFDVQNGFVAITRSALTAVPLDDLDSSYAFENSMLTLLNIEGQAVVDVPMPAIYADEQSHMNLAWVAVTFPRKLAGMFARRILLRHLLRDVTPVGAYLVAGLPLLAFSVIFGGWHWGASLVTGLAAPTGTIILALLTFLTGFILTAQAVNFDITQTPKPRSSTSRLTLDHVPDAILGAATTPDTHAPQTPGIP